MKTVRFFFFRAFLLIIFLSAYIYFSYGQERERRVAIARNVAWNDLVRQLDARDDPAQETLYTELVLIQRFLKEHQAEADVGIYDLVVLRAIDQAHNRLQKAERDLETIRTELTFREYQARNGR